MSALSAFKSRRLFQVAALYAVVAWIVVQVITAVEEPLSLPNWFDTATIVLLIAGFPIAMILGWSSHHHASVGTELESDAASHRASAVNSAASSSSTPSVSAGEPDASIAAPGTAATKPAIRVCTAPDGARIAFATMGSGPPVLKTANWLSHIELDMSTPVYGHLIRDLAAEFQLTLYDERLSGLSDWNAPEASLDAFVADMEAVRQAAGLDRFSIFALSQGCLTSVAYAARYPQHVDRMVLYGGFARNFREREGEVEAIATLIEAGWGRENPAFRQIFTTTLLPSATKEEIDSLNELMRASATPANAARLFRAVHAMDVRPLAPQVKAPTLVLHCRDDAGVPVELGQELAALIPGARFVGLPGENHLILDRDEAYPIFKEQAFPFLAARSGARGA
jgi:pimeloyl-ACP methyl ester carboxylesterase